MKHQHSIHQYLKAMNGKHQQNVLPVINLMSSKNRKIPAWGRHYPLMFKYHDKIGWKSIHKNLFSLFFLFHYFLVIGMQKIIKALETKFLLKNMMRWVPIRTITN